MFPSFDGVLVLWRALSRNILGQSKHWVSVEVGGIVEASIYQSFLWDKSVMKRPSILFMLGFYFPVIIALVLSGLYYVFTIKGLITLPKMTNREAAFRFSSLATIPLFTMIFFIAQYRFWVTGSDPLNHKPSPFFIANQRTLNNTLEQTFIFIIAFWASAEWNTLSTERLFLIVIAFIVSRYIFWATYVLGVKIQFFPLRGFGFASTFGLTLVLTLYNALSLMEMTGNYNFGFLKLIK